MITSHERDIRRLRKLLPASLRRRLPRRITAAQVREAVARRLNRRYRRSRNPADVLSFRYGDEYGEILLCPSVIRREARKYRNSYRLQLTWMMLHGMIHLAGLHHERSTAAEQRTQRIEKKILRNIRGTKHNYRS